MSNSDSPRMAKLGDWDVLIFSGEDGFAEVRVPSSSQENEFYGVVVTRSKISCHCRGYQYRSSCKHVIEVREVIEKLGRDND